MVSGYESEDVGVDTVGREFLMVRLYASKILFGNSNQFFISMPTILFPVALGMHRIISHPQCDVYDVYEENVGREDGADVDGIFGLNFNARDDAPKEGVSYYNVPLSCQHNMILSSRAFFLYCSRTISTSLTTLSSSSIQCYLY